MTNVDNPFQSPSIISFCTGLRGLERGYERALGTKCRVSSFSEIETVAAANLIAGMEAGLVDPAPVWTNLKTFPAASFHGQIDGIMGGYPCQPFSTAGNMRGEDDPRHLYPYLEHHITAIRPRWVFFENVRNHLSLGFDKVLSSLHKMGYAVEAGIYSAEEAGATQKRERLFILAILGNTMRDIARQGGLSFRTDQEVTDTAITGTTVGHAKSTEPQGWRGTRGRRDGTTAAGEIMADTSDQRDQRLSECEPGQERSEPQQSLHFEWGSEELADTIGQGLQGHAKYVRDKERRKGTPGSTAPLYLQFVAHTAGIGGQAGVSKTSSGEERKAEILNDNSNRWPAPPGYEQYQWEQPRTVESGVGCTVNGYNFREDLLRAYGNGVVDWTSSIAIIDLINKHLKNYDKSRINK